MKAGPKADQKCSCTSCIYKSPSERPSLRSFVAKGSRIDKLYFEKYIPLRERKLLERLVRTRGAYDDIRAQLLSDSTLSSDKPDLNPENRLPIKDLRNEKHSSDILDLVNLVDKGADLGSRKLSDCCSCCSCSSKIRIYEPTRRKHRFRHEHSGGYNYDNGYANKRVHDDYRKRKGVRFKAKHIRSDPCTCTLQFSGLINKQSKMLLKKIRRDNSVPVLEIQPNSENIGKRNKLQELSRLSYEKIRDSKTHIKEIILEGARKIKESESKIGENIRLRTKKSLENMKAKKTELRHHIKRNVRKPRNKINKNENDLLPPCLCPEKQLLFKIKKDSLSKFKDDLKKKLLLKDWECAPQCIEDTCEPKECFKKIKIRKTLKTKRRGEYSQIAKQDRRIGGSLNRSDISIQSQKQMLDTKAGTNRQKAIVHSHQINEIVGPKISSETNSKRKINTSQIKVELKQDMNNICKCEKKHSPKMNVIKTASPPLTPQAPPYHMRAPNNEKPINIKTRRQQIRPTANYYKQRNYNHIQRVKSTEQSQAQRQAVRIGSSFSFNVEFYKEKPGSNISHIGPPVRNTNRLDKRHKPDYRRKPKKRYQGSQLKFKRSSKDTQSGSHALKRCFCTLKLKSKKNKQKGQKASGSSKDFKCSSVSCNMNPSRCIESCDRLKYEKQRRRKKPNEIGTNTKLAPKVMKFSKPGKHNKKMRLLPYECEPGVCIPGDCIPNVCIKMIRERERKEIYRGVKKISSGCTNCRCEPIKNTAFSCMNCRCVPVKKTASSCRNCQCVPVKKTISSCTNCRCVPFKKTASSCTNCRCVSTSSTTSKSIHPIKFKQLPSHTSDYRKKLPALDARKKYSKMPENITSHKSRQAVRIGSSFSFNVEFYKDKSPTETEPTNVKSITFKPRVKQHSRPLDSNKYKKPKSKPIKKSFPTQMYKKERNALIGTSLKRCFCTLKLHKKEYKKKKSKMLSTGTEAKEPGYLTVVMSSKSTKINRKHLNLLEPFECEPYTCIPGECDPYICLEKINKRNMRTKNVGLRVKPPEMNSESSSTEKKRPVQVQFGVPLKSHKTYTKPYKLKKYTKKPKFPASGSSNIQAQRSVRLGSTFSFDIQFYKNLYQSPAAETPYKKTISINQKDRSVKNVLNTSHVDTQIKKSRKHKASLVKPILKRCFCTLNLEKKRNKQYRKNHLSKDTYSPLIYTVNEVITANTTLATTVNAVAYQNKWLSTFYNKFHKNLDIASDLSNTTYKAKSRTKTQSKKQFKGNAGIAHSKNSLSCKKSVETYKISAIPSNVMLRSQVSNIAMSKTSLGRTSELTGMRRLLKQNLYTMNVETKTVYTEQDKKVVQNKRMNQYKGNKLKPYECEPGVCIPGECNPYECQKLILERFKKHVTKKSGSDSISRTVASYTSRNRSNIGTNSTLFLGKRGAPEIKRIIPETMSPTYNHKQTVRIGSSFSFDMEFFKDNSNLSKPRFEPRYSSDTKITKQVKKRHKKFKTSSTNGREINFSDHQSQSGSQMADKNTHAMPMIKRCFCTLKLQKKGRLHKEHVTKEQAPKWVTRGQNTPKIKTVKIKQKLEPYECEPGICVPGYCDPYKCLEVIKQRRNQGQQIDATKLYLGRSVSSMTSSYQGNHRDRAIGVKPKKGTSQRTSARKYKETNISNKSRQAVRIGSNFSFNIEFFKDASGIPRFKEDQTRLFHENIEHKKVRKQKPTQYHKDLKHRDSQVKISHLNASTTTKSFLRRCFCTAQLHSPNLFQNSHARQRLGTLSKKIKLLKGTKSPSEKSVLKIGIPNMADKKMNTVKNVKPHNYPLESYECLPGICIPGECDPYKCYEMMNKRNVETFSRASSIYPLDVKPVASQTSEFHRRNRKIQLMRPKVAKTGSKRQQLLKTPDVHDSDRQAVKLGSSFSFNIEFYKQNGPVFDKLNTIPKVKKYKSRYTKKPRMLHTGAYAQPVSLNTMSTQSYKVKKENQAVEINNFLKRCFCVLKLNNKQIKEKNKIKEVKSTSNKIKSKSVMTNDKIKWHSSKLKCDPYECKKINAKLKREGNRMATQQTDILHFNNQHSLKLLPYECEPNVCIPYECDPYECEKRIKTRLLKEHHRDSGTSTNRHKIATASITNTMLAPKMKNRQTLHKPYHHRRKTSNVQNKFKEQQSRQSVRFGSKFTFDIEFYKKNGFGIVKLPKFNNIKRLKSRIKINRNLHKLLKNTGSQKYRKTRESTLQIGNELTRPQSTMTKDVSFPKRCFCTLYLKKQNKENLSLVADRRMTVTSDASTETNTGRTLKLLPYECEPQTCIPGECDPVICLERIKKREYNKKNIGLLTANHKKSVGSTVSGLGTKYKTKKYQTKPFKEYSDLKSTKISNLSNKLENTQRQVVRIGSSFSFDVEFFKNRTDDGLSRLKNYQPENKSIVQSNRMIQENSSVRHINTQALNNATKSVRTGITPILKRCFCTLQLQKNAKLVKDRPVDSKNTNTSRNQAAQSGHEKRKSKSSSAVPLLQRCFCTLKLFKSQKKNFKDGKNKVHVRSNTVATQSKQTKPVSTFRKLEPFECEPFTCIPGECDPHECAKRIKMRGLTCKSQKTATQSLKYSPKGVSMNYANLKSKSIQSDVPKVRTIQKENQSRIVEIPRFPIIANKNVVRIGSNINFNIEFYKETVPQAVVFNTEKTERPLPYLGYTPQTPKRIHNKKVYVQSGHKESRRSQKDSITSEDKASDTGNKLKRCFCTLKLQKKEMNEKIAYPLLLDQKFPQVFDVRRLSVQHNKLAKKHKLADAKSVATTVSNKYLKQCVCQGNKNVTVDDMDTILPYVPTKFNKKASKTLLTSYDQQEGYVDERNTSHQLTLDKGKRLTRKKSLKHIKNKKNQSTAFNRTETGNKSRKLFLHKFFKCFNNKTNTQTAAENIVTPPNKCDDETCYFQKKNENDKTDLQIQGNHQRKYSTDRTKKSQSIKKGNKHNNTNMKHRSEMLSTLLVGDPDRCPNDRKSQKETNYIHEHTNNPQQSQKKSTILKHKHHSRRDILCTDCEKRLTNGNGGKQRVHFQDSLSMHEQKMEEKAVKKRKQSSELSGKSIGSRKSTKLLKNSQKISKSCNYCDLCGSSVNKEDIKNAAGDRHLNMITTNANKFLTATSDKIKNLFTFNDDDDNICSSENEKPLFQMELDSQNYGIINQDEVIHSVTMLKEKTMKDKAAKRRKQFLHGKSCRCCICLARNQKGGANFNITAKGRKNAKPSSFTSERPCVCGSEVCAKKLSEMTSRFRNKSYRRAWQPCVCGSPVCDRESKAMKRISEDPDNITCVCMEEMEKEKQRLLSIKRKEDDKRRAIRLKREQKEDAIRKKRLAKENLMAEESIEKYAKNNDSDVLLLAESLLDVGKLGFSAAGGLVKFAAKSLSDPKGSYDKLVDIRNDPSLLVKNTRNAVSDSGAASTFRRIKIRFRAMRTVKDIKAAMEQHPFTNFLLNIADRSPNRRSAKKRVRERFDFSCSLYMGSLRKRPWLCVYDRCPWFYPHCLSILNVWRQFMDITLFLVAVAVWSPCILAMELCRAFMCCFLCTG